MESHRNSIYEIIARASILKRILILGCFFFFFLMQHNISYHVKYLDQPQVSTGKHFNELDKVFPWLYPRKNVVTATDIEIGHKWKTYLMPLSPEFNEFGFLVFRSKSNKNFITNYFDEDEAKSVKFQEIDHEAEVVIFQKLLASLNFVGEIDDADLVLIPALPVTYTNLRCRNRGTCVRRWFFDLFQTINSFPRKKNQKFLFLATQDYTENHHYYRSLTDNPLNILVNLGPTGLVVPSLNTMKKLQPQFREDCVPLEYRSVFLYSNQGLRDWLHDRHNIAKELDSYTGENTISRSGFNQTNLFEMEKSIFTICAPGDLPFQKRFFDAILMCSIPVVIRRETKRPGGSKAYWSNVEFGQFEKDDSFSVEESYPKVDFPYDDIVVEVRGDVIDKGGLMNFLESIPTEEIERKLERISDVRNNFVYDLDGTTADAFSNILKQLEKEILM